jgi:hypothetical protein
MITDEDHALKILKQFRDNYENPSVKCVYTRNEILESMNFLINKVEHPVTTDEKWQWKDAEY